MSVQLKCYNCGHDVIIGENPNIGICSHCFAEVPLPKDLVSLGQAYSHANELLSNSHFQEARDAFREILVRAPIEAAACWGYAVSEYGIEFVQDPATAQLLPTLHRLSNERFSDYLYVKKAIEYAPDYYTKEFYTAQSQLIDSIQSHSLQISRKEDPYDVFICYKKTETGEKRTSDSRIAADLYRELVRRGYKTFFAEETLHVGEEYEPRIFAALNSAKVLLAIGSREEYYEAVWVKNEWSRYIDLIETEKAQGTRTRLLIPVFYNIPHGQIPAALQKMPHYVDMSASDNPKQLLFSLISGHFSGSRKDDVSDLRRQVRGQGGSIRMEASADNFLTRGTIELVNGKFEIAREMFEKALAEAPSVDAYVGLAMCSEQIRGKEALHQYAGDITKNKFFARAMELAEGDKYTELQEIVRTCIANIDWEKKCVVEQRKCATAVEKVMDSLQTFSLPLDSHRNCAQTEETIAQVRKLQEKCKKESPLVSGLRMFLYLGNLIPAVFMLASSIARHFGWDSTIDWISMPGVLLGLVIYVLSSFTLLSLIPALDGGGFSVLIRLAAGFIIFMVTIPNLNGMEDRFTYLLYSAIASALFYLIFDLRKKPMFARLKAARENAVVLMQQLPQQIQLLEQETWNEIEKAMVPYQQYYRPDDWKEQRKHWKMVLNNACNARMNLQAQALQDITK